LFRITHELPSRNPSRIQLRGWFLSIAIDDECAGVE
jgi:hypothetical protein